MNAAANDPNLNISVVNKCEPVPTGTGAAMFFLDSSGFSTIVVQCWTEW